MGSRTRIIVATLLCIGLVFVMINSKNMMPVLEKTDTSYLELFKVSIRKDIGPGISFGDKNKNVTSFFYPKYRAHYSFLIARQLITNNFSFDSVEVEKYDFHEWYNMHPIPENYSFKYGDQLSKLSHLSLAFDTLPSIYRISDSVRIYSFSLHALDMFIDHNQPPLYSLRFEKCPTCKVKYSFMPMNMVLLKRQQYLYYIFQIATRADTTDPMKILNMLDL